MLLRQLFEALNDAQKKYVDDMMKRSDWSFDETRYDEIFGPGKTRIYLPMPEEAKPNATVIQALDQLGYTITDYRAGYAIAKEQKQYDIRRVLGKNPELLAAWEGNVRGLTAPQSADSDIFNMTLFQDENVINALKKMNYEIVDYNNGILTRENKPEAIGTILTRNKVDPSIINLFANDTYRTSATKDEPDSDHAEEMNTSNQVIVITRDKYEAAEVSTNKQWSSCLNLGGGWNGLDKLNQDRGVNAHYLVRDVAIGCIAAYLIDKNDTELDNPIARLSIKPFINNNDPSKVALGVHDTVYHRNGRPYPEVFKTIIHQWANDINSSNELEGVFELHPDAYNYGEFKDVNLKQYHGKSKKDRDTFEKYENNVTQVPDELRTFGYLLTVVKHSPYDYSLVYPYCKSIKEATTIAKIPMGRGISGAVLYFPEEFINEDINQYFKLVIEMSKNDSMIVDSLYRHNDELVKKLYATDSKKFLSMCQYVINHVSDDYERPLRGITASLTDVQMLSDLAKLKKLPSYAITNILEGLLNSREEIDTDVLLSIISNPRTDTSDLRQIIEYASNTNNKELQLALDSREDLITDSVIESINEVNSENDLRKIIDEIEQLSRADIYLPLHVYTEILNNQYINNEFTFSILKQVNDNDFVADYIKKSNIDFNVLEMLSNHFYDTQEVLGAIESNWMRIAEEIDQPDQIWRLTFHCYYPKVIMKLLKNNNVQLTQQDSINNIINKIRYNEYTGDGTVELAIALLPILDRYSIGQLFSIEDKMQQYSDDPNYENFQEKFNTEMINRLKENNSNTIDAFIDNLDYSNIKLFKLLLNNNLRVSNIDEIIKNIRRTHSNIKDELFSMVLPYFVKIVKEEPWLNPFFRPIYDYKIPEFNLAIIKYAELSRLMTPNENDDKEIAAAKLKRLYDAAKEGSNHRQFIHWLSEGGIPEVIQKVLLKNAMKNNNMDMLNALYSNTESDEIMDTIDEFLGGTFKYETLNQALEAVDMVDEWPIGRALAYGEDTKVPTNSGKIINISRGMNGKYSHPTVEDDTSPAAGLKKLVNQGQELGFISRDDLMAVMPDSFSTAEVDNVIEYFNELGIQIVDDKK
jgi:hypothetical protein